MKLTLPRYSGPSPKLSGPSGFNKLDVGLIRAGVAFCQIAAFVLLELTV